MNLQQSRALTKKSASNLALAFILLPRPKRDAMAALYAFCRAVDDVADEDAASVEARRSELAAWRQDIRRACEKQPPQFILNQEFQPVIQQFKLPFALFDELIKGCEMDLEKLRYASFTELELYCYRVASAVGLLSVEIFGYQSPASRDYAIHLGQALQLTNILRDVKNDAARGRIYLPQEELKKFGVSESEILNRRIFGPLPRPGRQCGGTGQGILPAGPHHAAPGRPPGDGGRRTHGQRLLGPPAETGTWPIQRVWRPSAQTGQVAQTGLDCPLLGAARHRRPFAELRDSVNAAGTVKTAARPPGTTAPAAHRQCRRFRKVAGHQRGDHSGASRRYLNLRQLDGKSAPCSTMCVAQLCRSR